MLQAENIRSARCSRVILSKLLAASKANFFISARARKKIAVLGMLAKTIRHPFICLAVSRVLVCLLKINQLRDCRATVNAKSHAGKKPLLAG